MDPSFHSYLNGAVYATVFHIIYIYKMTTIRYYWMNSICCTERLTLILNFTRDVLKRNNGQLWTNISRSWRGVLDTTLCDKVCQWLATGRWFSSGTSVSSTNKTDHHDITKILLKVALNTITITTLNQHLKTISYHLYTRKTYMI
jgi:hypothetical protein